MSTPTPRTDAVLNAINRNDELERIYALARALETELAAAKAEREQLEKCRVADHKLFAQTHAELEEAKAELATLRAELATCKDASEALVESLRADAEDQAKWATEYLARAERAEAALAEARKDSERLDWLDTRGPWESWNGFGETGVTLPASNVRDAIDAAMKEGKP